jgi:hypothetical protein
MKIQKKTSTLAALFYFLFNYAKLQHEVLTLVLEDSSANSLRRNIKSIECSTLKQGCNVSRNLGSQCQVTRVSVESMLQLN